MTRHHYESVGNALNQLAAISHVVGRAIPLMGTRVQASHFILLSATRCVELPFIGINLNR